MIKFQIDNHKLQVENGTTILEAARNFGISIPTMCHLNGYPHFTSCMICVVQEKNSGKLLPACSAMALEGMVIGTDNPEVHSARKAALELLLSEHVGDCEGPCQRGCPAQMNIPKMLRLIESGYLREALMTVKEDIALPAVLGRICPAPCEKICRRGKLDQPVSICQLKRYVADVDLAMESPSLPVKESDSGKTVAIIGAGPTGLSAAYYLLKKGHRCTIFDNHPKPGGMLRFGVSKEILRHRVLNQEIDIIRKLGAEFQMNVSIGKDLKIDELSNKYDVVIIASGDFDAAILSESKIETTASGIKVDSQTFQTNIDGIFAGGNVVRKGKLAVRSVAHGRSIATSVDHFLSKKKVIGEKDRFNSRIGKLEPDEKVLLLNLAENKSASETSKEIEINLPLAISEAKRCLHCECLKPEDCKLRQYTEEYDANSRQYKGEERSKIEKFFHHSNIVYEVGKCIKCGICVRITEKHGERLGLTFIGRGFDVRVGVPLNKTLDEGLEIAAKVCVEACPTGALAFCD